MEIRSLSREFSGETGEKLQDLIVFKWGADHPVELSVRKETADKLEKFKFPIAEKGQSKTTRVTYKIDPERAKNLYVTNLEGGPLGFYTIGLQDKQKSVASGFVETYVDGVAQKMFTRNECEEFSIVAVSNEPMLTEDCVRLGVSYTKITNGFNLSQYCFTNVFGKNHPTTGVIGGKEDFFFALYEKTGEGFEFVGIFLYKMTKDRVKFLKNNKPHLFPSSMEKDKLYQLNIIGGPIPQKTYTYSSVDYSNGEELLIEDMKKAVTPWNEFMEEYISLQANLRRRFMTFLKNEIKSRKQIATTPKTIAGEGSSDTSMGLDDEIPF